MDNESSSGQTKAEEHSVSHIARLSSARAVHDTPASPLRETSRSRRPTVRINGYELLESLGKGGMGKVYKATQKSLGRIVAIKTLNIELAHNKASVDRFAKEAAAMAQLRHPNIVYVIDRGCEGNQLHYFVMEYVDGPSLRELLRTHGSFTPHQALDIMYNLSKTMSYAHNQGVVHRDLKPENILYNSDGDLKVADFGLAGMDRETTHIRKITRSYVSMGTECYMAPEQRQNAKHVDARADIYSMGVMFYELLTGELPFPYLPAPEVEIVQGRPDIDSVIRCCLELDRENRYENTDRLVAAIEMAIKRNKDEPLLIRDTVIDAPAIDDHFPLNKRIEQWYCSERPAQEISSDDELQSIKTWSNWRRWLWSSLGLIAIAVIVLLFFLFAPKPKVLQKVSERDHWQLVAPIEKKQANGLTTLEFNPNIPVPKNYLGRLPPSRWKVRGHWFAENGMIQQNTYHRGVTRNHNLLWANYIDYSLGTEPIYVRSSVMLQRPHLKLIDPHNGQITTIAVDDYLRRRNSPKTSPPIVGIGLQIKSVGRITLLLKKQAQKLMYKFGTIDQKKSPDAKTKKTAVANSGPKSKWFELEQHKIYKWGQWIDLELRLQESKIFAYINGQKINPLALTISPSSVVKPGLICRNAHCVFQKFQIDIATLRRSS
jgi:serine/threonine protein kinase